MDVPPGVVAELRGLLADRRGEINNLLCDLAVVAGPLRPTIGD